jgi:hypothetical protein
MARTPNYGFEKRRREMERKAKQDAKAARKKERTDEEAQANAPEAPAVEGASDEG